MCHKRKILRALRKLIIFIIYTDKVQFYSYPVFQPNTDEFGPGIDFEINMFEFLVAGLVCVVSL